MDRVGVITFLHNENYGSTLQAWALQQVLLNAGYDAVHLDYRPSPKEKLRNQITSLNSPSLLLDSVRKRLVKSGEAGARRKADAFDSFYRQHMRLTGPCHDADALRRQAQAFDVLVAGSDQIWSPEWFNPVYYLSFADSSQARISYAPSLGVSQLRSRLKAERIRQLLVPFSAVSVREEEGAALLRSLSDCEISVMPDPVFLLPRQTWQELAGAPWSQQPYIAVYFIGDRPDYWETVKQLHEQSGLPVVVVPVADNAYHQSWQLAGGLSPDRWLGLLNGASMIVTDSFHGASFAMLLGKQVRVLRRYSDASRSSKNSRIDQLYRQLAVTDPEHPDPDVVEARLAALRLQGTEWLLSALRQAAGAADPASAR